MKVRSFFDRQSEKTIQGLMATHLSNNYHLSPMAVQTLLNDVIIFREIFRPESRQDGQIIYYAIKIGEPAGKSIKECELIPVKLTVQSPEDLLIRKKESLRGLTQKVILRLAQEAFAQGALLTIADLSHILRISERSVLRHKKEIKEKGLFLPLRGEYQDIGPCVSHKKQVLNLFLLGYPETTIAQRLHHSLENIETYIRDFLRVVLLAEKNYHLSAIIRIVKLSKGLVQEYLRLYKEYSADSLFDEPLKRILKIYSLRQELKKKGDK